MSGHHHHGHGSSEKSSVALTSVLAALLLTGTKIGIGFWTGSLGVLAEAMHSGLDLVAALVTLWAVRASGRPADSEHAYGHGKIENLSALFETLLLLGTCAWIIKEAVTRLFFRAEIHVEANVWSFLVVIASIVVDYSRSRALLRVAKKFESQALEADALHFATDIWSSLVVLLGLAGVFVAHEFKIPWLTKADAVAALGVAVVVVVVSIRLGKKSIADLLDTVPSDLATRIAGFARVEGVREVRHVRVRRSGPEVFIDLSIVVDRRESLQRGHEIACGAEAAIKRELPRADIVVHVEPAEGYGEDILAAARRIAASHDTAAHNLAIYEDDSGLTLEMHLEMSADLPLSQAHRRSQEIDDELRATIPRLCRVVSHIEPAGETRPTTLASTKDSDNIKAILARIPELQEPSKAPQNVEIRCCGSELSLSFRCTLPGSTSIKEAHDFTEKIERSLRSQLPNLGRIMARIEPAD